MASYIINDNGNSDYSRADFVSALEGLQPLLVSGRNIKTINGNSVLGSGNIEVNVTPPTPQEYPQEALLTDTEKKLRRKVLAYFDGGTYDPSSWEPADGNTVEPLTLNGINPINPSTGKRKFMSFAFITDLHTCFGKNIIAGIDASEMQSDVQSMVNAGVQFFDGNGDATINVSDIVTAIKDDWPSSDGYMDLTCEPSVRLAGAIAHASGLDAVIVGGDLSSGRLPKNCYRYQIGQVKKLFDKYVLCRRYTCDGNHDRMYHDNVTGLDYQQFVDNADWQPFLRYFNSTGAVYLNDKSSWPSGEVPCNTYYADFPDHKVRLMMRSYYDNGFVSRQDYQNIFDCYRFDSDTEMAQWNLCMFAHSNANDDIRQAYGFITGQYYANGATRYINGVDNSSKGLSSFGQIEGHWHRAEYTKDTSWRTVHRVKENCCFGSPSPSESGYCVAVFVYDTDNFVMHHLRIGKYNEYNRANDGYYITYNISHN